MAPFFRVGLRPQRRECRRCVPSGAQCIQRQPRAHVGAMGCSHRRYAVRTSSPTRRRSTMVLGMAATPTRHSRVAEHRPLVRRADRRGVVTLPSTPLWSSSSTRYALPTATSWPSAFTRCGPSAPPATTTITSRCWRRRRLTEHASHNSTSWFVARPSSTVRTTGAMAPRASARRLKWPTQPAGQRSTSWSDDAARRHGSHEVSLSSPVGRALAGARAGDVIHVHLPNGRERDLTVLGVTSDVARRARLTGVIDRRRQMPHAAGPGGARCAIQRSRTRVRRAARDARRLENARSVGTVAVLERPVVASMVRQSVPARPPIRDSRAHRLGRASGTERQGAVHRRER